MPTGDHKASCPNCGYCPHCGRANGFRADWTWRPYPYYPWGYQPTYIPQPPSTTGTFINTTAANPAATLTYTI